MVLSAHFSFLVKRYEQGKYNSQIKERIELEEKQKMESGPYLVITSPCTGNKLEVTNLIKFNAAKNSDFWKAAELNIKVGVRNPTEKMPHTLFAQAQLQKLQFTEMRVVGTEFNDCAGRDFVGEKVAVKFEDGINPREPTKTARWITVEGKKLGIIDARSPHLLAGCEAIASITSPPSNSVIITSLKNPENKLQIDRINQYAFANHNWQGEQANITLDMQQTSSRKAPVVFAKLGNQVLGVLNKESVGFLQQQLVSKGRTIQGLTIAGTVNKAPPNYADIVIDPNSVKFPDIQLENQNPSIATVAIITGVVEPKFQAKTEQVLGNMFERAVKRAVESGFNRVQFVDISPNPTPQIVEALRQIVGEHKDIRVEFVGKVSLEEGMKLLTQPSDIVLGVKTAETIGMIEFVANRGNAVATYIPETGGFERYNLPLVLHTVEVGKIERER